MTKLKVNIDDKEIEVERSVYVKSKTKQLREFGYAGLTEEEVSEQIDALLAGKTFGKGLTVIGAFMGNEIVKSE